MKRIHKWIFCVLLLFFLLPWNILAKDTIELGECGDSTIYFEKIIEGSEQTSYLIPTNAGWTAVRFVKEGIARNADGKIVVYQFDSNFHIKDRKTITSELPVWGGFYAASDAYYFITGQYNTEQDENLEVFRITKFDMNWNRVQSVGMYACDTMVPFEACRMDMKEDILIIHTGHQMYDGHQANATILVNTKTMTVTDSSVFSGETFVSHSFDQYVKIDGSHTVTVDLGDAAPRAAVMFKSEVDFANGKMFGRDYTCYKSIHLLDFCGPYGDNYTGASLGGLEIAEKSYLVVGSSVIQDEKYKERKTKNIFVVSVDKSLDSKKISWLTSYSEGDGSVSTPQIVKIGNGGYMVLWSRQNVVYYTLINESGDRTSQIYSHQGDVANCKPIFHQGKVYWYTVNGASMDFYEISASHLDDFRIKETCEGHQCKNGRVSDGVSHMTCSVCKANICINVPSKLKVGWNLTGHEGRVLHYKWLSSEPIKIKAGEKIYLSMDEDLQLELNVSISDESKLTYVREEYYEGYLTAWKDGKVNVTISHKWDPDLSIAFQVQIGDVTKGEDAKKITDEKNRAIFAVTKPGATVAYTGTTDRKAKSITIPSTVKVGNETYKVTSVAKNALKNNKKLQKVTISGNVASIGASAFQGCTALKTVKMGSKVTAIGDKAFSGCKKLFSLTIGKNVSTIGKSAFQNCAALKKITIPAKVKKIGASAFSGCKKLMGITVQSQKLTEKNVGSKAFAKAGSDNYKKMKVTVPTKKYAAYRKLLKKKGLSGKAKLVKK